MAPMRSTRSGIPRRTAATPMLPRTAPQAETPMGQIRPVFDGFSLAENSVWADTPPAPVPSSSRVPLPTASPRRTTMNLAVPASQRDVFTRAERFPDPTPAACSPPSPPVPERAMSLKRPAAPEPPSTRRRPRRAEVYGPVSDSPREAESPLARTPQVVDESRIKHLNESSVHANRSVSLDRLRRPGERVCISLMTGGRTLSRVERARESAEGTELAMSRRTRGSQRSRRSHLSPVLDASVESGEASGSGNFARLPADSSFAKLDVPPILPSSTPAASRLPPSKGLFASTEPSIAYPEDVSRSWISATPAASNPPRSIVHNNSPPRPSLAHLSPRRATRSFAVPSSPRWASPELSKTTMDGKPEDWETTPRTSLGAAANVSSTSAANVSSTSTTSTASKVLSFLASLVQSTPAAPSPVAPVTSAQDVMADTDTVAAPTSGVEVPASQPNLNTITSTLPAPEPSSSTQDAPSQSPIKNSRDTAVPHAKPPSSRPAAVSNVGKPKPTRSLKTSSAAPPRPAPVVAKRVIARDMVATRPSAPPNKPTNPRSEPITRPLGVSKTVGSRENVRPKPTVAATITKATGTKATSTKVTSTKATSTKAKKSSATRDLPVRLRDLERARELAIKRAVVERLGEQPKPPARTIRVAAGTTTTGTTPGRATRARAAARAQFEAELARRRAEEEERKAEIARVQAEIEEQLDRESRKAAVIRARPLPAMYARKA